jgi:fatty acid desaturase
MESEIALRDDDSREADSGSHPYVALRRSLLSPERVRNLSVLHPGRAVRDAAVAWLWIVLAWFVVARWPQWWTVALAIPLIGSQYYALFIIGHDGLHRRIFSNVAKNDLFSDLIVLGPIGAITRINNQNHLKHHWLLGTEEDPDRYKHACFNKTDLSELFIYIVGLSSVPRMARNVFSRDDRGQTSASPVVRSDASRANARYTLRDIAILVGWQTLLIVSLTLAVGWWGFFLLWLVPVFAFTVLADNLRTFLEHSHPEADALADRHRLITYDSHPLERAFLAPMNMNLHAAHHLWPSIPYYNLPLADSESQRIVGSVGLIRRSSYLGYLYEYYLALPLVECKKRLQGASAT